VPDGPGCARRAIDLRSAGRSVVAWLEDDFHHFGIEMRHDGTRVVAVEGKAERYPRDTCPGAVDILQEVVGIPLDERCTALGRHTNMRLHCTHLYDLLGLAIAHAASGREHRRYDAMVPDRITAEETPVVSGPSGRTFPELLRDGETVMRWEVVDDVIAGPANYAGISLGRGFRAWTETLAVDEAEAAHVLRRATLIAMGRRVDLQALPAEALKWSEGVCHSFQPDVARRSRRMLGTTRDFSDNPRGPLASL
jgi:hypothetical protein